MNSERILVALALLVVVSACGVDGPPTPPPPKEDPPTRGITIIGEASAGVIGRS